ncbi:5-oxoprolinase subunit B family protein [Micromonospora tarensis]|uniref:Carboxyltransferase domain-containing protein n=1 Tax=Micromonospora tarensis TaxID=2806100 RepID=A0ABS1YFJ5_9ACTN|nr:carboxyltransferase domain-containing protein [Micromonospora tarensis]MBM0276184.1 carboxyltransferase domain-containing protein [Micromonospora tarensis]
MRIRPVGAHALLLDCIDHPDVSESALVEAWRAELWRRRERGDLVAVEIVPAARTILLDGLPDPGATAERLARWAPEVAATARRAEAGAEAGADATSAAASARTGSAAGDDARTNTAAAVDAADVVVPVVFDGPDLPAVAEHWGVPEPAVADRLTGTSFRVAFCGFAPGFPYLTGLPAELALPRLATPRPRVPAGSVALAGPYAGIYPGASPGGWLLVGRTDLVLFDVAADPPTRLAPGTTVRMVPA